MKAHGIAVVTVLLTLPVLAGPADVPPKLTPLGRTTQTYKPASRNTDFLRGTMRFSEAFASFSLLRGHMDLSYRGEMPDPEGLGTRRMLMFRVTNAARFWNDNKGRNGFCRAPVEWMGATQMLGNSFRISFFEVGGRKGLLDEGVTFRDHEEGGLGLCSADTFVFDGEGVKTVTTPSGEVFQFFPAQPMTASDLRKFMVGAWRVPDGNFDKLPEQKLRLVQLFNPDGTGVVLPWQDGNCGSDPLRRFSWSIKGEKVLVTRVKPAGDLLIGTEPVWVNRSSDGFGYFHGKASRSRLAFVPQCPTP